MNARKIAMMVLTAILVLAAFMGAVSALNSDPKPVERTQLANVRDYTGAANNETHSYAVDGGVLFAGELGHWQQIITPQDVIVSAVAVDSANPDTLYIGAANELAIYRSVDGGQNWLRVPMSVDKAGGVTDIAVDGMQRIVYVGTDTAGLFRLRDVGSSMTVNGQLLLDEPVLEVAAGSNGEGLAFARTEWNLYRAENYGLAWVTVDNLHSAPTAVAVANTDPATVYVGTVDRGLLTSQDGITWNMANEGLNFVPGSRLQVNDLAIDPAQPEVVYVATSYLYGTSELRESPAGVAYSTDSAQAWTAIEDTANLAVAELMPVSGLTGGVYALSDSSRTPQALGSAPVIASAPEAEPVVAETENGLNLTSLLAWAIAALAAVALAFAVAMDLRSRRPEPVSSLSPSPVRHE